ncbi:MAG: GNAT family N-acetyltransferase [Saprospiraceae bacterium]|nr:GNAT family N-acetyltransferase [Saprospiraceae bacterium]
MSTYKVLNKQIHYEGDFSLVPIRMQDRYAIMQWRNEQIYHLRQHKPLTKADQDTYFENVVSKLFNQEKPVQILFSFLENDQCIGYGGLVHINWINNNAEISFLLDTDLEKTNFDFHYSNFLKLIEKVAFDELNLHKINTYAFDLRPFLYPILEKNKFEFEARLKEQIYFEGNYIDAVLHRLINPNHKKTKS